MDQQLADLVRRHLVAENGQDLSGRFLGIEPTGQAIAQPFVVTLTFKDGLMLSERFQYDLATLLRQIGADQIPALGELQYRAAA